MRRLLVISTIVSALAFAAGALAAPVFVITGKGWGHGIGMSQWGAYGYAQHGWGYRDILGHYYTGTSVAEGHGRTVTVLLASGRSSVAIGSDARFTAASGGKTYTLAARAHTLGPALVITDVNGKRHDLASPVTFLPGTRPLELGGRPYRGRLVVRSNGTTLAVANRLSLDAYVKGVVPREMPASWHLEALKAQAVAARSYALASGGHCSFGPSPAFCATIWDQVYGGIAAEEARSNLAVDQTAGEAVVYPGKGVAVTFFFSTSGGRTATRDEEWESSGGAYPYLISVDDPYDSISYHHTWGPRDAERDCSGTTPDCVFTTAQLSARLGSTLPRGLRDLVVAARSSRSTRVETVTAKGATNRTITGATMRSRLGLRSTWFSIGVLSVTPARTKVVYGSAVSLSGLARGVGAAYLERRPYGGSWVRVRQVAPGAEGAWSTTHTPWKTTDYRVVAASANGTASRVSVAVRVNFYTLTSRTRLRGIIGPKTAGASVAVQKRQSDGTWKTLATVTTNAAGEFTANVKVTAGAYRAVARLGGGYVPGTTPVLNVS